MLSLWLSMLAFILVGSIAPGPVCVVTVSSAARVGLPGAMPYVLGASLGYALMVLLLGLGLLGSFAHSPQVLQGLAWVGAAYMLYLAWRLARAEPGLPRAENNRVPGFWAGALAQWLNPKAWLFSLSGLGLFVSNQAQSLAIFCMVSLLVCLFGVGCWAVLGHLLGGCLPSVRAMRVFNLLMALLLVLSVMLILWR
ncbi:LysE family translocator [Halopseudomonas pachastrellae]|uniref:LysE family translocator n=1 Tax=Halopseudomonas pachastrellae TaxID=254161 RepID=UPI003D7D81F5